MLSKGHVEVDRTEVSSHSLRELQEFLHSEILRSNWLAEQCKIMESRDILQAARLRGEGEEEKKTMEEGDEEMRERDVNDRLVEDIQNLKTELYDLSVENEQMELLKQRFSVHTAVLSSVTRVGMEEGEEETGVGGSIFRRVQSGIEHRDDLVVRAMHLSNELEDLRSQVRLTQLNCANSKITNRSLWREIKEETTSHRDNEEVDASNPVITRLENELHAVEHENAVLRNTLQNIIVASEVDWAQDERLTDVMMNLHDFPGVNSDTLHDGMEDWTIGEKRTNPADGENIPPKKGRKGGKGKKQ